MLHGNEGFVFSLTTDTSAPLVNDLVSEFRVTACEVIERLISFEDRRGRAVFRLHEPVSADPLIRRVLLEEVTQELIELCRVSSNLIDVPPLRAVAFDQLFGLEDAHGYFTLTELHVELVVLSGSGLELIDQGPLLVRRQCLRDVCW